MRRPRPWFMTTPWASTTIGMITPSQAIRRTDSGGTGWPSNVSHTVCSWDPPV